MPSSKIKFQVETTDFDFSNRYKDAIAQMKIGLWYWEVAQDKAFISGNFMAMLGFSSDPVSTVGDFLRTRIHPQDRLMWQSEVSALINGHSNGYQRQIRMKHKRGYWLWFEDSGQVVESGENGRATVVEGAVRDISFRKKTEVGLRLQEEQFRQTFEFAPIGLALVGLKGEWLRVNRSLCAILGYSKDELYELTFQDITYEEDLNKDLDLLEETLAQHRNGYQMEKRYYHKSGKIIWANLSVTLVQSDTGDPLHFISQIQDITDNKSLMEQTKSQNERLLNFAYIVSHNLRSHSSNLLALLDLLQLKSPELASNEFMQPLGEAAQNLHDTIQDLDDVTKIQLASEKKLEKLAVKPAIEKALVSLSAFIRERNATIKTEIAEDDQIYGIPAYFNSVLLNFLTNALKYSSPDRQPLIEISTHKKGKYLRIDFKDNGLGIDLQRYGKKLFKMYKTFHNHEDSRGVGLFITKNQIEVMGGKVEVESEAGKGTTFSVFLKHELS